MPSFAQPSFRTPFGIRGFLRSTQDYKTESYTLADGSVPKVTIDDADDQQILNKGVILAKITSGADSGKVGPYVGPDATDEVQTVTVNGGPAGGTFTLVFRGEETDPIDFDAAHAAVQAALRALPNLGTDVAVTGDGPYVVTFQDQNVPLMTVGSNDLTGGTDPSVSVATTTPGGGAGSFSPDGREQVENVVGINNTFLPWQLMHRDVEVAAVYEASVVLARVTRLDSDGATFVAATLADIVAINRYSASCRFLAH